MEKTGDMLFAPQELSRSNIIEGLQELNVLKEKPNTKSSKLLQNYEFIIRRSEELQMHNQSLELCQAAFITAQHIAMRNEEGSSIKSKAASVIFMAIYLQKSLDMINKHRDILDKDLVERNKRNQGKFTELVLRMPTMAKSYYQKCAQYFLNHPNFDKRFIGLELLGSVAYMHFKAGQSDEGIRKTEEVVSLFKNSDIGKKLQRENSIIYSNWLSIIYIRGALNYISSSRREKQDKAISWMREARELLFKDDDHEVMLQDRIQEFNSALENMPTEIISQITK